MGNRTLTKMMYGWSKYGGGRHGLIGEETMPEWTCQACGSQIPKIIPPFMFPVDNSYREFLRICANCQHQVLIYRINKMIELFDKCRKPKSIFDNLNRS